jgi:hypothetical protein
LSEVLLVVEGCVDKAVAKWLSSVSNLNLTHQPVIAGGWTNVLRRGVALAVETSTPIIVIIDTDENAETKLENSAKIIRRSAEQHGYELLQTNNRRILSSKPYLVKYSIREVDSDGEKTLYLLLWGDPSRNYEAGTVEDLLWHMIIEKYGLKRDLPDFCKECPCVHSRFICDKLSVLVALATCSCKGTIARVEGEDRCGLPIYNIVSHLGLTDTSAARDYVNVLGMVSRNIA